MDAKAFEKKSHDFYQQIFLAKNPAGKKLAAFRGGKKVGGVWRGKNFAVEKMFGPPPHRLRPHAFRREIIDFVKMSFKTADSGPETDFKFIKSAWLARWLTVATFARV
jgi:hypothetical protein